MDNGWTGADLIKYLYAKPDGGALVVGFDQQEDKLGVTIICLNGQGQKQGQIFLQQDFKLYDNKGIYFDPSKGLVFVHSNYSRELIVEEVSADCLKTEKHTIEVFPSGSNNKIILIEASGLDGGGGFWTVTRNSENSEDSLMVFHVNKSHQLVQKIIWMKNDSDENNFFLSGRGDSNNSPDIAIAYQKEGNHLFVSIANSPDRIIQKDGTVTDIYYPPRLYFFHPN